MLGFHPRYGAALSKTRSFPYRVVLNMLMESKGQMTSAQPTTSRRKRHVRIKNDGKKIIISKYLSTYSTEHPVLTMSLTPL